MTDSVAVFNPGYRLTDSATGAPIVGATISFYDAQTTTPKTVYSDADLTVALGTSVVTDSLGCPTSDGSAKTDVYVGTSPYKVVVQDADDVVIETKDNRPGAVVSVSATDTAVTALFPLVTKSLDYTILQADQNTTFAGNCSSATINFTLPSAVAGTVSETGKVSAAGWTVKIQHAGSANRVVIKTVSSQTISEGSKSFGTQFVLTLNGEDVTISSDGGNWRISSHTAPFIKKSHGIIPIVSRLATSPGSPAAGDMHLLTGTGGSWSGFTTGDIALYTGAAWINFTPYTDCGWRAYIANENLNYQFQDSAWVAESATASFAGTVKVANQAAQETSTANDTAVTPGTQQFHPSAAKWWIKVAVSAGTPSVSASYNNTSITDTGTGDLTVTIATDFSSANWACEMGCQGPVSNQGRAVWMVDSGQAAGAAEFLCYTLGSSSPSATDPTSWYFAGFGDQ